MFLCNWLGSIIVGSLEQIFKREGLRGMYRGLSPTVLALLPNWAVSIFALFTLCRVLTFMLQEATLARNNWQLLQVYFTIYDQLKSSLGADG